MIHFTSEGIFADTEEEREEFYKQANSGEPMLMAHLALYRQELKDWEVDHE